MNNNYDIIITGAGAAGLLLAYRMSCDDVLKTKRVLIIDASDKTTNDRTWCYWEEGTGFLDEIVHSSWDVIRFAGHDLDLKTSIDPYTYKMIKGLDFYHFAKSIIQKNSNVDWLHELVINVEESSDCAVVKTTQTSFKTPQVFNSILFSNEYKSSKKYPLINQHFIGWFVKTKTPAFNPEVATFMDFTIPQKENTRFMYVLPTSPNEALFEYTLFSKDLLESKEYEQGIIDYLSKLGITDYEITEIEQGCIPMTCYPFWNANSRHIHHIGMAGGWTKASTGYTFMNSIKRTKILIEQMKSNPQNLVSQKKTQFWFYDLLLIDILSKTNHLGSWLFSSMFKTSKVTDIFMFLDEESSFIKNMKTISKMPKGVFTKALINRLLKRFPQ